MILSKEQGRHEQRQPEPEWLPDKQASQQSQRDGAPQQDERKRFQRVLQRPPAVEEPEVDQAHLQSEQERRQQDPTPVDSGQEFADEVE